MISIFFILKFLILIQSINCFKEDALNEKIEQLTDWSLKKPVIRLNTENFKHFVKTNIKNYSVIVMLTALNTQRQCQICRPADNEYQIIAQSWRYSGQFSNKLFFAMVDFDDAPEVFQMLKTASAPQFIHFPRKGKPKSADFFDISRVGFSAEQIAKWVYERSDIQIKIFRPPNYSGFLLLVIVSLMVGAILYVKRNNLEFLYNKNTWSFIVIGFILIFISGQMWNQIRNPPPVHRSESGQIGFFAGSHGYQFIAETYIVLVLYGAIIAGFICMNEAPAVDDTNKKSSVILCGVLLVSIFFSIILYIFRSKYQGYPYRLFF